MNDVFPPPSSIANKAHITAEKYQTLYRQSIDNPQQFWADMGTRISWFKKPTKIKQTDFTGIVSIKWYDDGILNACYNCLDRHLPQKENDIALIWEGNEPGIDKTFTYGQLYRDTCRAANALKKLGVKKGDRVVIYMPMVIEAVISMLACARIGAIHSVVFGGFSPDSLKNRIQDAGAKVVITADEARRGAKSVPLKANMDAALADCPTVQHAIILEHTAGAIDWNDKRDIWWHDFVDDQEPDCPCEPMDAEDPLFILYTSGSTGKPKGVVHTTGGYMVYASLTHEWVFDYKPGDIYWCTADVGWVTGHTYIVYGPLANGATSVIFEGIPTYPDASRYWQVVDKHKVSIFYTAPTAIRSLLSAGDEYVKKTSRASLRVLGSVGEPINAEAWHWYHDLVGGGRCPIADTWWQTETGGHVMTPLPGATPLKPGSACWPFFGIRPGIIDSEGNLLDGEAEGQFVLLDSWPGQMRTVYGDHDRFIDTYFKPYKGMYLTGDGARRDKDGYYWITGRVDDVLKVSGHRLGTAEIESAIDEHEAVAEAAVVGYPHDIKGQGIYAFVTLCKGCSPSEDVKKEIVAKVREIVGPIASPDIIQFAPALPKTRSGKIMRRILRKIAANELDSLGDTSTLAEPEVVDDLVKNRPSAA